MPSLALIAANWRLEASILSTAACGRAIAQRRELAILFRKNRSPATRPAYCSYLLAWSIEIFAGYRSHADTDPAVVAADFEYREGRHVVRAGKALAQIGKVHKA